MLEDIAIAWLWRTAEPSLSPSLPAGPEEFAPRRLPHGRAGSAARAPPHLEGDVLGGEAEHSHLGVGDSTASQARQDGPLHQVAGGTRLVHPQLQLVGG